MSMDTLFNVRTGEMDWSDWEALTERAKKQFPFEWIVAHESLFCGLSRDAEPGSKAFWTFVRNRIGPEVAVDCYYCERFTEPMVKYLLQGRSHWSEPEKAKLRKLVSAWRAAFAKQFETGVERFVEYCHTVQDTRKKNSGVYEYQLVNSLAKKLDEKAMGQACEDSVVRRTLKETKVIVQRQSLTVLPQKMPPVLQFRAKAPTRK